VNWCRQALLLPLLLGTSPVLAQAATDGLEDLRPKPLQMDNLMVEELPLGNAPTPAVPDDDALSISEDVFGPRVPRDEAYGAFQRGYFLTALSLALPRAEKNDAAAQTLIAEIYAKGLGVAENLAQASGWYALASRNGDKLATFELAMLYQDGAGVPKNRAKAAELFKQAADLGCIPAKYNLGLLHVEGVYVEPSLTKAATLIGEAAEAGLAEAQYDYGTMLLEGAGVAPDLKQAVAQIKAAAEQGLVSAQIEYATLLYLGRGVPRDLADAVNWYRQAAEAGSPVAQNRYAKLLAAGEGIGLDLEEAAMWRALARRQGLTDPVLDRLLISITPMEMASAEERARFWPSVPPTATAEADLQPPLAPAAETQIP
jgi:TPR repeat protein